MIHLLIGFAWWIIGIVITYTLYFVFRTWYIFRSTMEDGFFRGLFDVYLGEPKPVYDFDEKGRSYIKGYEPKYLRLYHIVWMVIDLPCIIVGSCLPFIRRVFTFRIAAIQRPSREEDID